MNYTLVDMETYPRREHYEYYENVLKCGYNATTSIDVTNVLEYAHTNNYSFYACMIYVISKTVNSINELKMMKDKDGNLGIWDTVYPSFTIFHEDDHTFSDIWMEYDENIDTFMKIYTDVINTYGNHHGMRARDHQPPNFFCISSVPWLDFSGYSTTSQMGYAFFPIITYGKYNKVNDKYEVSLNFNISHSVCDGYHTCLFFNTLQDNIKHLI